MSLISITPELVVPAPPTGCYLGAGPSGPVALRLLRSGPTRITVFSAGFAAQLVAMRAALAGIRVRVVSDRPEVWGPVVQHGPDARVVSDTSRLLSQPGPAVIVDTRPGATTLTVADGQCLIDLRSLRPDRRGEWIADFGDLAQCDLALFGVLSRDLVVEIERSFGLDRGTGVLSRDLPPQSVTLVRRGAVELVRVQ